MNVKNFQYSLKNIPIPKDNAYLKCLIDKTEHFIKWMRWKAFFQFMIAITPTQPQLETENNVELALENG